MKKYISILTLCLCMGTQYIAFAGSPCSTAFALNYAFALRDLASGTLGCKDATLEGPCREEVQVTYRHVTHNIEVAFNECCCVSGYVECCN